ncbi:MAG: hypothetical protein IKZ48_06475 [Prevotella sp.]|nr:hypothetical protein [Prevotella sp.]
MTNEELYIRNKLGRNDNPFAVPEGYFSKFTERVMQQIPDTPDNVVEMLEKKPRTVIMRQLRPWFYAAASVCLFVFGAAVYTHLSDEQQPMLSAASEQTASEIYVDEAADYAMIDNHDIYLCLMNE